MILPDLLISTKVNQRWQYSGIDSLEHCRDKKHFLEYPYSIDYQYNSRGFRDDEWSADLNELRQHIWCIGDSFTVGIGSPYQHIWPKVLSQKSRYQTINVSMDGASNNWIARKSVMILNHVRPRVLIIMWSYLSRRESADTTLSDEDRRLQYDISQLDEDVNNLDACVQSVIQHQGTTRIMMFAIPKFARFDGQSSWTEISGPDWPKNIPTSMQEIQILPSAVKKEIIDNFDCWPGLLQYIDLKPVLDRNKIQVVPALDRARDGHHFDIATSKWVAHRIMIDCLHRQ